MNSDEKLQVNRRNFLIGAGMSAAILLPPGIYSVPGYASTRTPESKGEGYLPALSASELTLVAAMSEGIIPHTDTPGAIAAGVHDFIALLFNEWMSLQEQQDFRDSLTSYENAALASYGSPFALCSHAQQSELLNKWDEEVEQARQSGTHTMPPFARFKSMTLVAYYTSEIGQTVELKTTMDAGQYDENGPLMMPIPFHL